MTGLGKSLLFLDSSSPESASFSPLPARFPGSAGFRGDIYIKRENFSFYFPLATSIIISVVLSLILWLLRK